MAVLHLLAYAGGLAAFLFVTLSLASGLLWLAELIEEHSKYAKSIGMRAIYAIIGLHVVLYFTDALPLLPILFSILCHVVYLQNFSSSWPFISLTSPRFILSCVLVVADHFTWFFHFAAVAQDAKKYRTQPKYRYGGSSGNTAVGGRSGKKSPAFGDVAAFFAICVWFVPLFLFLSLSANDNVIPSFGDATASPGPNTVDLSSPGVGQQHRGSGTQSPTHRQLRTRSSTSLVKSVLNPLLSLLPKIKRSSRNRGNEEGLIAPRTPIRGSPLHSPVIMPQSTSQSSYFPWGSSEDQSGLSGNSFSPFHSHSNSGSGSSSAGGAGGSGSGNLTPDRARTPPPPRRIQSEISISKGTGSPSTVNPRGIATRNGRPALAGPSAGAGAGAGAGQLASDYGAEGIIEAQKRTSPLRLNTSDSTGLGVGSPAGGFAAEGSSSISTSLGVGHSASGDRLTRRKAD
ncbi:endoplasmic reticulum protein [Kwoniella heveanensis CBS 569]|nr:endoplasmic reticulum protein [Kwoniella heveanensis CBS 569]